MFFIHKNLRDTPMMTADVHKSVIYFSKEPNCT